MIEELLENERIEIHFQPIISIRQSKVIGMEALTRAKDETGFPISPAVLFLEAKKENLSFKLDEYVRTKSLESFQEHYQNDPTLLLFLNFESHLLDGDLDFSKLEFTQIAEELKIPNRNVVLEIKEDEVTNNEHLKEFCEYYKSLGFIIALDDFGAGSSNFERLATVRPNLVKIDRSLVYKLHQNFIHKEIIRAIANMCFNMGAIILAEGVEEEEEILKSLQLDIDFFQGYWFAKPQAFPHLTPLKEKVQYIGQAHSQNVRQSIHKKEGLIQFAVKHAEKIIENLQHNPHFDLQKVLEKSQDLEAIYIIDETSGIQFGPTIIDTLDNRFFHPANEGDDHSLKEYFYITKESKRGSYLSTPYISRATGAMCRTFSQKFTLDDMSYILCLDIKASALLNHSSLV